MKDKNCVLKLSLEVSFLMILKGKVLKSPFVLFLKRIENEATNCNLVQKDHC